MLLDLTDFQPILAQQQAQLYIWDGIRGKYILLTPEEWVRQAIIDYLAQNGYPKNLMQVEKNIAYPRRKKRPDIICYDRVGEPFLLVECKAQAIALNENTLIQAQTYNWVVQAPYMAITNGREIIVYEKASLVVLNNLPTYPII